MRYGIPLLKNRVSPRCTIADSVMLVNQAHGKLEQHRVIPLENGAWTGLIRLLLELPAGLTEKRNRCLSHTD
jgi:hypothetical protein